MRLRLVAIRHAKPIDEIVEDEKKVLSSEGRLHQKKLSQQLKKDGLHPTVIYTSPIVRAVQSSEILAEDLTAPIEKLPALGSEFNENELLDLLRQFSDESTILLVGHAPTLANFVNHLVGENVLPAGLPKSGAALINFDKKVEYGIGKFIKLYTT